MLIYKITNTNITLFISIHTCDDKKSIVRQYDAIRDYLITPSLSNQLAYNHVNNSATYTKIFRKCGKTTEKCSQVQTHSTLPSILPHIIQRPNANAMDGNNIGRARVQLANLHPLLIRQQEPELFPWKRVVSLRRLQSVHQSYNLYDLGVGEKHTVY